uniref:SAM-dependent MTase RsmB/NOP-type domain-containing protein n=1 Tax=Haptolina ericina TaxID=156174 RepID=A0A7S3F0Y2_9EUKA
MRRMLALQATRTDSDLLGIDRVRRYADPEARAESLPALQRRLLTKAFGVLRAGGVLLYVTCSSEAAQGEKIIEWFLASTPEATLERVETHGVQARRVGETGAMVRFSPTVSATSGLFVCRLGRRA